MCRTHTTQVWSALVVTALLVVHAATPLPSAADTDAPFSSEDQPQHPRLGLNVAYPDLALLRLARDAGASYDRVDFPMSDLHPDPNTWQWASRDELVAAERAQGLRVLGVLTQPPIWAVSVNMIPSGLNLPWNDPGNLWAQYVYQVAQHYQETVDAWQIWNEPDLDKYWSGPPGASTERERMRPFAQLMKVSYQAIKAANPNATVVTAGFLYRVAGGTQGQPRVIALWQELAADPQGAANRYFFDAAAFHLYDGGTCEPPTETWYDVINDFRRYMVLYAGDHPLWITEAGIRQSEEHGFGTRPPSTDRIATLEEAASYVIQNSAYALYKDVAMYYYFRTRDDTAPESPDWNWGLVRLNGTPRPSYLAYRVAASYLPPTYTLASREWWPSGTLGPVSRISFWGTPYGRVSVLWNTGHLAQTYVFATRLPTVTLVRQDGITATLLADNSQLTFTLDAAPNFNLRPERDMCLVASQPLILIERDTIPPTSTLTMTANLSASLNVTLTWTGRDDLSGIWHYDLQYRSNSLSWTQLLTRDIATQYVFVAQPGAAHDFRVRAHDRVGNPQDWATANIIHLGSITLSPRAYLPVVRLQAGKLHTDADQQSVQPVLLARSHCA